MCIAIYQPQGLILDDETLKRCHLNNPDGCGMAYIREDNGKIEIYKSLKFKKWLKRYHQMTQQNPESPFLIHFRIKTHGVVSTDNCHPFKIDKDHVFIHNGMITKCAPKERDGAISDTRLFNQMILQSLPNGWFDNDAIKNLIEPWIGNSKLAILKRDGSINIINEEKGNWHEGVWFSNTSYEATYTRKKPTTTYYGTHQRNDKPVGGVRGMTTITGKTFGGSTTETDTESSLFNAKDPREAQRQLCRFYSSHPDVEFVVQSDINKQWHPAYFCTDRKVNVAWHFGYKTYVEWNRAKGDFDSADLARAQNVFIANRNKGVDMKANVYAHLAVERHEAKLIGLDDCEKKGVTQCEVVCDGCGKTHYYRNLNEFRILSEYKIDLCGECESRYMASSVQITKLTFRVPV